MSNSLMPEAAGAGGQLDAAVARVRLPDDWSGKGACPVCRTPGQLRVQHLAPNPDQMVCGACGTAFEVEAGGPRIRLAAAPPALVPIAAGLVNTWLTPARLRAVIDQAPLGGAKSPVEASALGAASAQATTSTLGSVRADEAAMGASLASPPAEATADSPKAAAPKPANGSAGEPEGEPGTEDWFASLAAVIGGLRPVTPPTDTVLADELERILSERPEPAAIGSIQRSAAVLTDAVPTISAELRPAESGSPSPTAAPERPADTTETAVGQPVTEPAALLEAPANQTDSAPGEPAAAPLSSAVEINRTPATDRRASPPEAVVTLAGKLTPEPTAAPDLSAASIPAAQTALVLAGAATPAQPPKAPPTTRRELAERAWKLHELGNSLESIQATLEGLGGTPDDVGLVMSKLVALEQARQARFRRTLRWTVGGGAIVLVVLLAFAALLSRAPAPVAAPSAMPSPVSSLAAATVTSASATRAASTTSAAATSVVAVQRGTSAPPTAGPTLAYNPIIALLNEIIPGDVKLANGPTPVPAPTSALFGGLFPATPTPAETQPGTQATQATQVSNLPPWVSTLIPPGITVINVPTPSVDSNGPPVSPCPSSSAQAAALFGGPPASWSFNHEEQGWIFILASSPTLIRVPAEMSAGYLVIGNSLEMRSASGPATLHNVNFVAISCQ